MLGQANFAHKELQHKSSSNIQDMLMLEKGINWNNCPTWQKRGSCAIKHNWTTTCAKTDENGEVKSWVEERPHWIIDNEIPIFRNEGREYIETLVNV
jgi:tRNA(His) 5'-end guanylyltransferase